MYKRIAWNVFRKTGHFIDKIHRSNIPRETFQCNLIGVDKTKGHPVAIRCWYGGSIGVSITSVVDLLLLNVLIVSMKTVGKLFGVLVLVEAR